MSATVATRSQVNGMLHTPATRTRCGVTGLMSALVHTKSLPDELQHFGHEWHGVQIAVVVERGENLVHASHFDELADSQVEDLQFLSHSPHRRTVPHTHV